MIHENIELTGSFTISGSFNLPNHESSASISDLRTGSIYNDSTDNVVKVYNGNSWVTVGEQTAPEAGPASADIEYLLVAGGGGGGSYGGGGAGGYLSSSLSSIQSGSTFTITVGSGGAGSSDYNSPGVVGVDSSIAGDLITTITALGGGYGGDNTGTTTAEQAGDGGSGGGGSDGEGATPASPNKDGGSGTVGQGNDGGDGTFNGGSVIYVGGGGGGAGTDGADATLSSAGAGGNGLVSSIIGTSVSRAGGGGGVTYNSNASQASGGTGGGGNGGTWNATTATSTPLPNSSGGTVNTGGGGGATNAGGSGVAIFAYDTGSLSGLGGLKTLNGGRMVHTFNSSGTLTIAGAGEYPVANGSVFAPVIYTGNGGTQSITSVGFQPDLVWIKSRTQNLYHFLVDSVRGDGLANSLSSNTTDGESFATEVVVNSLDTNGFTLNADDGSGYYGWNMSNNDYVAWCFKAGGTVSADNNSDGDITSTVSANPDAGFSIVKYTGNEQSSQTIGHGLSSTPELAFIKQLDGTREWQVPLFNLNSGDYLILNDTDAATNDTARWSAIDSSTITVGAQPHTNGTGSPYIGYFFHSVDGYQKIGSYTGTGSTLPNTITGLGFQPRFLLLKNSTGVYEWVIKDSERGAANEVYPNDATAENGKADVSNITFNSDGFSITTADGATNQNNATIIYLAIA